jgi:hypothetical protein
MSKTTLPRSGGHASGYCWAEHATRHLHCTLPTGHAGPHWHPYTKTSWS